MKIKKYCNNKTYVGRSSLNKRNKYKLKKNTYYREKAKKINYDNINPKNLKDLIKNAEDKNEPIFKIDYGNGKVFKSLDYEISKKLLSSLDDKAIKKINYDNINLEILNKLIENAEDKNDPIFKIDFGNGKVFKSLDYEISKKLLSSLDDKAIKKINYDNINLEILNKLIENAEDKNNPIFKINYEKTIVTSTSKFNHITYYSFSDKINKLNLNNKNIGKLLLNLDGEAIKKIDFLSIPFIFFKYLSENINNKDEIIEKLKMINYLSGTHIYSEKYYFLLKNSNNKDINEVLEKLELNQKIKEVSFEDFELIEQIIDFCEISTNYELIKKYLINKGINMLNSECLSNSEICQNKLIELIKETSENDINFKKIMDFNYFEYQKILGFLFNKLDEENLIKLLKNTINISKNILNKSIDNISTEKSKNKIIKNLYQQLQIKKLIKIEKINISDFSDLPIDNFMKTLEEINEDKTKNIVLSNIFVGEELEIVIEKIIEKYPNKLPIFDIGKFSESKLFSLIKGEKIKNTNILKNSNSSLIFLKDSIKFNIVQKILKNNSLFLNGAYNSSVLEELTVLDTGEIKAFIKFYCNCQKPKIEFKDEGISPPFLDFYSLIYII